MFTLDDYDFKTKLAVSLHLSEYGDSEFGPFEDTDHPICDCGSEMNFYGHDNTGDFPYGEGLWKCDSCGFEIKEDELPSLDGEFDHCTICGSGYFLPVNDSDLDQKKYTCSVCLAEVTKDDFGNYKSEEE